jgi:hypothetical protein
LGIKNDSLTDSLAGPGLPEVLWQTVEERAICPGSKNELIMPGIDLCFYLRSHPYLTQAIISSSDIPFLLAPLPVFPGLQWQWSPED